MINRTKRFITQCHRVLKVTRKPTMDEFKMIIKMSGIGISAIGLIGFLITFFKEIVLTF